VKKSTQRPDSAPDLRRRAEVRLRKAPKKRSAKTNEQKSIVDIQRVVHELQVHQVELEMQNLELRGARDRMETLAEKYTDLYDFAPVGYFSIDATGRILEANLSAAALLGVERSRLLQRRLPQYVVAADRKEFMRYLDEVFAGVRKRVCEARLQHANKKIIWASFHSVAALSLSHPEKWCRVMVSDLTVLKRAEESQRRVEALAAANEEANREIARREAVETALRNSEQTKTRLLAESRELHMQLRHVTHQILRAQEDERKNISRELHDEVAQILAGINVQLAALTKAASTDPKVLRKRVENARKLVEQSIETVHKFARELRPTLLDDLGLVPALRAFIRDLHGRRRLHIDLTVCSGIEGLDAARLTVMYRVAQEALTNIVRHAHAHLATVEIRKTPRTVVLEVRDDGKSFPVERVLAPGTYKRLGLLGMRERVEMVGGTFAITSAPGQGTTVSAELPFLPPTKKSKS
jgi:PAS domain S-box-containing protein